MKLKIVEYTEANGCYMFSDLPEGRLTVNVFAQAIHLANAEDRDIPNLSTRIPHPTDQFSGMLGYDHAIRVFGHVHYEFYKTTIMAIMNKLDLFNDKSVFLPIVSWHEPISPDRGKKTIDEILKSIKDTIENIEANVEWQGKMPEGFELILGFSQKALQKESKFQQWLESRT